MLITSVSLHRYYHLPVHRAQRLLETKVLKERPIWLDVVEAYPPLPHPIIPEHLSTGRLRTIEYPEDAERTRLAISI